MSPVIAYAYATAAESGFRPFPLKAGRSPMKGVELDEKSSHADGSCRGAWHLHRDGPQGAA
jgi:hypothetical protein